MNVCIFEDNKHLRESLQLLLETTEGFDCVGAFANCNQLVERLEEIDCDICLMDIQMPGISGIDATKIIKEHFPQIHVLIQTVFSDDDSIFRAICAGASGYILKSSDPLQYIEALKDAESGGAPMSPTIARRMLQLFKLNFLPFSQIEYNLTDKEKMVLQQLTLGKSYKMIADELTVSIETVKTHMKNIYTKLHVHSSTEAVAKAIQEKLV
ncbi:LuxR family two component transcriptional regulator [Ulvibacter sp. MAR_2010_11]|uniref:response regulator transcription factor n=1 Tax=Ulvibacter sp. MAR_2010_11 TaxID=1250229 RepID=UPI000C2CB1B3|nr:response regulator transcription factor [Ulvibacter sp. MAR_2010_11]PKA84456.1 LuxR family two component transcriptional regulator [Ulvibacter sp. MAR_2010_11]